MAGGPLPSAPLPLLILACGIFSHRAKALLLFLSLSLSTQVKGREIHVQDIVEDFQDPYARSNDGRLSTQLLAFFSSRASISSKVHVAWPQSLAYSIFPRQSAPLIYALSIEDARLSAGRP